MKYGSVCSGIEAVTVAWHSLGWMPSFFSEIDNFPRAVLGHHYPEVPLHGDFTTIGEMDYEPINLLVGGTPCQSFSIAGLRKGMDDERGNLALEFLKLAQRLRPKWIVWENVPGVLSSNGGKDFGSFLGGLGEVGYGFAYRVLDAQYFGVAQRRRRVFVVGHLGDWRPAAAVLFERHSLSGHPKPSRETGQRVTPVTAFGVGDRGETAHCLRANASRADKPDSTTYAVVRTFAGTTESNIAGCLETTCHDYSRADGFNTVVETIPIHDKATRHEGKTGKGSGNGLGIGKQGDPSPTLTTGDHHAVCFQENQRCETVVKDVTGALSTSQGKQSPKVMRSSVVRRLTPIECERLQGFPDNYTKIPYRNKPEEKCPDGPRYKALGNSMAVPVMKWIGERIEMVEAIVKEQRGVA